MGGGRLVATPTGPGILHRRDSAARVVRTGRIGLGRTAAVESPAPTCLRSDAGPGARSRTGAAAAGRRGRLLPATAVALVGGRRRTLPVRLFHARIARAYRQAAALDGPRRRPVRRSLHV